MLSSGVARIIRPDLFLFGALLFAATLLLAPVAHAEPTAADRTTARVLARQGYEALRDKDYATAADRFARADALVHAPTLLLDLARAQVGLGRLVEAYENYNRIIREGVAADSPPSWTKALADANAEVGAISPRLGWVTISVTGPSEPRVVLNGKPISTASLGVKRAFDPGHHKIRASGRGYVPQEKEIDVAEGQAVEVALELEPGTAEAVDLEETVAADGSAKPAQPKWRKPTMIATFGVGGAGLVLGGVTGVMVLKAHSELSEACPNGCCGPAQEHKLDRYHTLGLVSTIGFVVAGAGGALGTVLLLTEPKQEPAPTTAGVRAFLGLGGAGVEGAF